MAFAAFAAFAAAELYMRHDEEWSTRRRVRARSRNRDREAAITARPAQAEP
jgi:hypothetical protein